MSSASSAGQSQTGGVSRAKRNASAADIKLRTHMHDKVDISMTEEILTHRQDEVRWEESAGPSGQVQASSRAEGNASAADIKLRTRAWCGQWAVPSSAFTPELVGAKSLNTIMLRVRAACSKLIKSEHIPVPLGAIVRFIRLEAVLF